MFALYLIVSFCVGGIFIALQTLIAERVPQKWRGPVLTVPSTLAVALFFIGVTKTPADVANVALVVPAALTPDYLFVMVFALLSPIHVLASTTGGLFAWAGSAYALSFFPPTQFWISALLYAFLPILLLYFVLRKQAHVRLTPVPMNAKHILIRSLIGGSVIVAVIVVSKLLGNIWGGILSAFPAAFTSTLLIYYRAHGKACIPAVAATLFFPGVVGFIAYAWVAGITFPLWGIWLGTLASYLAVFVVYAGYLACSKFYSR